jgi:hypothetical protein
VLSPSPDSTFSQLPSEAGLELAACCVEEEVGDKIVEALASKSCSKLRLRGLK